MSGARNGALPPVRVTIGMSLLVRLLFASALGYGVDEAYAVSVARPFSPSYFDHPPLHFWIAGLTASLTGTTEPLVIRLPFIAMFCVTMWAVADITRRHFGEHAARIATVALAASGVLGLTSATWVLPDGPLLCGSAIGVWALSHVVGLDPAEGEAPREAIRRWWCVAGAAFAVAALSKYHAVLLVSGAGGYFLIDRSSRKQLRTPWPWLALAMVLAALLPVVLWNAQHDWASFRFQGGRARSNVWSPAPFFEMLLGQTAWLFPWIALPLAVAACASGTSVRPAQRFLLCVAAVPVLVFSLIPLGGARGLPHWTAPGWLFVFPLLGAWGGSRLKSTTVSPAFVWPRWLSAGVAASVALLLLVMIHVRSDVADRWLSARARDTDPSRDAVSWSPAIDPSADVLLTRSWIQAGQAGAASGVVSRIVCLCEDAHHFAFRTGAILRSGERGLLLERLRTRAPEVPATALGGDTLSITLRDTVALARGVKIVRYDVTRRANAGDVRGGSELLGEAEFPADRKLRP